MASAEEDVHLLADGRKAVDGEVEVRAASATRLAMSPLRGSIRVLEGISPSRRPSARFARAEGVGLAEAKGRAAKRSPEPERMP